ncbi:MAG: DnaA regulatory inactivator Hda [Proteobacteria bacterium]|nr:MAG: DnaA regulatory inactivator Hda [Pseudomonadota bacterium]
MQQLSLNIALLDNVDFASFYLRPDNQELLSLLKTSFWESFPQLFIFGLSGSGKSHLLQACCVRAQETGVSASYLSLRQLALYGTTVLDGLDHCALVAVDDLGVVMGDLEWEAAIFHLINRCRENRQALLMAARRNPRELDCYLPDLISRFCWGPIYGLNALNEQQAIEAFRLRATKRGFEVADNVLAYIRKRFPLDMCSLMDLLERLDRASLDKRRKITIHFVQETFSH